MKSKVKTKGKRNLESRVLNLENEIKSIRSELANHLNKFKPFKLSPLQKHGFDCGNGSKGVQG